MLKNNSTWKTKRTSQFMAKLLARQTRFFLLLVFLSRAADLIIILPSILLWFTSSKSLWKSRLLGHVHHLWLEGSSSEEDPVASASPTRGDLWYQSNCSQREDSSRRDHSRFLTRTAEWCHQRGEIKNGRISPFLTASRGIIHPRGGPYVANKVRADWSEKEKMNKILY